MAIIKNNSLGKSVVLNAQHVFGRNKYNACTYIPDDDVSNSHATIFWKNGYWYVQDHSRNGTLVNGKQLIHNTIKLSKGDILQYGKNKTTKWEFIDCDMPSGYLISLSDQNKILTLPSSIDNIKNKTPEVTFYCTENKKWKAEKEGKVIDLVHGVKLHFNDEEWMFVENTNIDETTDFGQIVSQSYFLFILSGDEERIQVKIITNELEIDLGERVHNYLLLSLARKRLIDADLNYVFNDQGWIDIDELAIDLSKEFAKEIDDYYLNVQIHRLRKYLNELIPYGYLFSNVIERKKKEIRFAHPYFKIQKEGKCIGEIYTSNTKLNIG
ncbi:FHA domain-containing protein [Aquimarina sp. 2201CG5-10]|uniref:FHA domain-containing protein n=1 Tax=Aquimarina callyspongiae TaxID=3098150 RepID=UPI002AB4BDA9|nr:FHA domain-containing protein [Aquimarina sp. 2201CG5-10]MDY8136450.1 FHA domain-containing protein [Aquimarina sp. 2201CG5-10]